ncbi:hypothetical protein PISMIDRAFT_19039 [Pisolithus microcarpus 441]|uniref:Unplaced genomic scaffold scaffold_443, whole genome shotgun sequence n=1 Tax=Pisolithus microcarpus 441 TaxID=765257 RepID=A0A0C9Y4V9_9AGAM|nr:hypothetical protein PISMIDRAFT_19039 [Pisolithus microcarpus 441]
MLTSPNTFEWHRIAQPTQASPSFFHQKHSRISLYFSQRLDGIHSSHLTYLRSPLFYIS